MVFKSICLIGASGNLGTLILKHLKSAPENYTITVLSRESSTAKFPEDVPVTRVPDTYPVDKLTDAFNGIDVVIASLSMMGMGEQYNIINACLAAGVKRYFPTEFGLDELPDWLLQLREMFKIKHDVRDYLIANEGKGLEWTSICCNAFFEMGIGSGFFQFDWTNKTAVLIDGGTNEWVATTLDTVAVAVVKAIEKADVSRNRILLVQDFETSQKQILDAVQKRVSGWTVEDVIGEAWLEKAKEAVRAGDNSQLGKLTFGTILQANAYEGKEGFGNEVLGLPTKSFDEAMEMFWMENESLLKS